MNKENQSACAGLESVHELSGNRITGRFNDLLFAKMQEWLKKNDMSINQLLARAVERYISETQVLEPVEVMVASKF